MGICQLTLYSSNGQVESLQCLEKQMHEPEGPYITGGLEYDTICIEHNAAQDTLYHIMRKAFKKLFGKTVSRILLVLPRKQMGSAWPTL